MGHNSLTLSSLQHDLLGFHLKSFHPSLLSVLRGIHLDLDLFIGLAPDFDYLGPYQIVGLSLLGVLTLSKPAPSALQETLLAQCSLGNAD